MQTVEDLNTRFATATPEDILRWCWDTFGELAVTTSSFQSQSVALLYMISQVVPHLPVLFIDTGFHFAETLAFRDELTHNWGLKLVNVVPEEYITRENLSELREMDPDYCCLHAKVAPLQRALNGKKAWITGIRRDQTFTRQHISIFAETSGGMLKVMPLATWSREEIKAYILAHNLPAHPLKNAGYLSIGCAPCTVPVVNEYDERSGRWVSYAKTECGLHTTMV
ncbi:MAG TPA: phosphoadenylyl-sulfate reductase [Anaerolineales bacterium]|nr:phosphoadenylyl-sulfate reductase [Anaerolineales bacterium]